MTFWYGFGSGVLLMLVLQLLGGAFWFVNMLLYSWCILHGSDLMRLGSPRKNGRQPRWYRWLHGE